MKLNPKVRDILMVMAGTFLVSIAINMVYDPLGMVTGGVTGLAIIIKSLTAEANIVSGGIPLWLTNIVINVPLFLAAIKIKGKRYIMRTAFAFLCLTVFLYLVPTKQLIQGDFIIASVVGGVLSGAGMGLIFLAMFTTGGTDLLCALIHEKKKYYSMPRLLAIVDGTVVLVGVFVFGFCVDNKGEYGLTVCEIRKVVKVSLATLLGEVFTYLNGDGNEHLVSVKDSRTLKTT